MYSENRSGPSTDPWGTPQLTEVHDEGLVFMVKDRLITPLEIGVDPSQSRARETQGLENLNQFYVTLSNAFEK